MIRLVGLRPTPRRGHTRPRTPVFLPTVTKYFGVWFKCKKLASPICYMTDLSYCCDFTTFKKFSRVCISGALAPQLKRTALSSLSSDNPIATRTWL